MPSSMLCVAAAAATSQTRMSGTGHGDAPHRVADPDAVEADALDDLCALHDVVDGRPPAVGLSVWQVDSKTHAVLCLTYSG